MTRTFDKDYKHLLTHLIPQHRLSVVRRKQIRDAVVSGKSAQMRVAAVLALEDLYRAEYFDRSRTHEENGHVVVTYAKNNGSYQIRLVLPADEWRSSSIGSRPAQEGIGADSAGEAAAVGLEPIETTINILPDIIRSLSIDGQRESTLQRLDSVVKVMPRWFSFAACRLILVEERLPEREGQGELVVTWREKAFQEAAVYQRCRHSRETAVLDRLGARAAGIPGPFQGPYQLSERLGVAVAPVFSNDEFWGVLEAWGRSENDGAFLRSRAEIASGIVGQIIENSVRLENLTSIDKLTGVYNRQFYDRLVRIEMERATRSGTKVSLLVLDIDDFKQINDTMGHRKGDEALVVVADLMRGRLRKIDLPFRYGGEEFVVLLPGTAETEAIHTAERLRTVIESWDEFVDERGHRRRITVSIGAAVFPDHARTEEELFSKADAALYMAKRKGKNRVEFYHA
jgi:diguanylate cyclase (GGDEF)-like protein